MTTPLEDALIALKTFQHAHEKPFDKYTRRMMDWNNEYNNLQNIARSTGYLFFACASTSRPEINIGTAEQAEQARRLHNMCEDISKVFVPTPNGYYDNCLAAISDYIQNNICKITEGESAAENLKPLALNAFIAIVGHSVDNQKVLDLELNPILAKKIEATKDHLKSLTIDTPSSLNNDSKDIAEDNAEDNAIEMKPYKTSYF
jgi:hypothetical protein